jgi:prepilin-type N-terminal cleavage/methylation domain-containing protein
LGRIPVEKRQMTLNRSGHSLIELLVCIAIIGTLMAMSMPVYVKALRKAQEVGVSESMRQSHIARQADNANIAHRASPDGQDREACRGAYRRTMSDGSGDGEIVVTEMLYDVQSEAEFRAYWYTLIDPDATDPLAFDGDGNLMAVDEEGDVFLLVPIRRGEYGMAWEFLSSVPRESSAGTLGTVVAYPDGHTDYVRYPGAFPACRSVAELSHQFMVAYY